MARAIYRLVWCTLFVLLLMPQAQALTCTVSSFTGSFGSVGTLTSVTSDSSANFSVSCSFGLPLQSVQLCINIGPGTTATGNVGQRVMRSGSAPLTMEYYSDAGRSSLWGSWGTGGSSAYPSGAAAGFRDTVTLGLLGSGTFNYTVYGRVPGGQTSLPPGTYVWNGVDPTIQYRDSLFAPSCPVGSQTDSAGGSTFTATVAASCQVSASPMNFGTISSPILFNVDATAVISVTCTSTTPYSLSLSNGANASGTQRRLRLGASSNYIAYGLFTDPARTKAWNTTTSSASCTAGCRQLRTWHWFRYGADHRCSRADWPTGCWVQRRLHRQRRCHPDLLISGADHWADATLDPGSGMVVKVSFARAARRQAQCYVVGR